LQLWRRSRKFTFATLGNPPIEKVLLRVGGVVVAGDLAGIGYPSSSVTITILFGITRVGVSEAIKTRVPRCNIRHQHRIERTKIGVFSRWIRRRGGCCYRRIGRYWGRRRLVRCRSLKVRCGNSPISAGKTKTRSIIEPYLTIPRLISNIVADINIEGVLA